MVNEYSSKITPTYNRRPTRTVWVGQIAVGGNYPIRVQSMTTSNTKDTPELIREIEGLVGAGCEIIRVTVPTPADCKNLPHVRSKMKKRGLKVPLVADIHFTPSIAMEVVPHVEKVRINPGNFADKKLFKVCDYSDAEYAEELNRIREKFTPLVLKCKEYDVAMRIGTNHGSLSDRIMNRYGDTPEGMVESALEFLRIAADCNYHNIVLSMKASNVQVMIHAYRLLADRLNKEGTPYPFHLGVTEAGEGDEGRIKSAIGIGSLLEDGIGDTVRVSLTEDAIFEVPVAYQLVKKYNNLHVSNLERKISHPNENNFVPPPAQSYRRRQSERVNIGMHPHGKDEPIRVWSSLSQKGLEGFINEYEKYFKSSEGQMQPLEGIELSEEPEIKIDPGVFHNLNLATSLKTSSPETALRNINSFDKISAEISTISATRLNAWSSVIQKVKEENKVIEWVLEPSSGNLKMVIDEIVKLCWEANFNNNFFSLTTNSIFDYRLLAQLTNKSPLNLRYELKEGDAPLLSPAIMLGSLLNDGLGDCIQMEAFDSLYENIRNTYNILQGSRVRTSKTEYISCPSCGRTQFNLQSTTERIRQVTSHLKGVKIAVMGCIVNGPGEMADADFGYVGTGPEKVSLYVGKECVERNITEEEAVTRLINLIKTHNRWAEVPSSG